MKPAATREEFISFQQLMNICSALVVTALWSVVLWVQCRAQLMMLNPQVQSASDIKKKEEREIRTNFLFASFQNQ